MLLPLKRSSDGSGPPLIVRKGLLARSGKTRQLGQLGLFYAATPAPP